MKFVNLVEPRWDTRHLVEDERVEALFRNRQPNFARLRAARSVSVEKLLLFSFIQDRLCHFGPIILRVVSGIPVSVCALQPMENSCHYWLAMR